MKKYFVLLSGLLVTGNMLHADEPTSREMGIFKICAPLLVGGAVKYAGDATSGNKTIQKLGEAVGLNPHDATKTAAIAASLGTYALMETDDKTKSTYTYMATRLPVIVIGMGAAFNKNFQKILAKTPLVGDFINCDNPDCTGTCKQCIATKGTIGYGVGRTMCIGVDWGLNYLFPSKQS